MTSCKPRPPRLPPVRPPSLRHPALVPTSRRRYSKPALPSYPLGPVVRVTRVRLLLRLCVRRRRPSSSPAPAPTLGASRFLARLLRRVAGLARVVTFSPFPSPFGSSPSSPRFIYTCPRLYHGGIARCCCACLPLHAASYPVAVDDHQSLPRQRFELDIATCFAAIAPFMAM